MRYNHALTRGVLDPVLRELVVLRTAHLFGSDYEWNLHTQIGAPLGIGPDTLAAIRQGPDSPAWTDDERLCLSATDVLCREHDIDDALWAALAGRFGPSELMELLFLVGSYTLLAWVLKTVRMPLEDLAAG
jgi:alkylhydroperoxidase family enzyme